MIPENTNCKNREFKYCNYYTSKDCPQTCFYAEQMIESNIGACDSELIKIILKEGKDE